MWKVVIVDDERWIRRGLIQSIPWDQFGLELVGEAGDGQEAYTIALEQKPDLLFLDMRMPGLDGKELIAMLNRDMPELLTVVVSGYSDFEYTKEAIRHKAFDYLLKPVKKEELAALLEKATSELAKRENEKRQSSLDHREDWLQRILFQADAEGGMPDDQEHSQLPKEWTTGESFVLVGQPDIYRECSEQAKLLQPLREQLNRIRPFLFGGRWNYVVTTAPDGSRELVMIIAGARLQQEEIVKLNLSLQTVLKQADHHGYSFGISEKRTNLQHLREAYLEAKLTLKNKSLSAAGTILFTGHDSVSSTDLYPQEKENAFLLSLHLGNKEAAGQEFEQLFTAFSKDTMTVDHMQRSAILLIHSIEKQLRATDTRLQEVCGKNPLMYTEIIQHRNDAASVKSIFDNEILPHVLTYYSRSGEKQGEKVVREVQKLIEAHYDQPLSLHQIATSHYMNTDYLSRLFKKTTGHNFVDYLMDIRINKSKELMKLSKYKNYEIAQMVGYEDYRYFSQIFKKKTGMTIGDYRILAEIT
ncbi:response regulator [Paenibacillus sp. WQ 127069]|uniref:Response regulator n=1 Tax=Paenibacillus baimaensis TaxID=2982185 RepID=A0ABT2UCB6_9BACL|nr:response regulator [Paenibacillus sp. WQ 127069]MCU6792268.1 response regulator [Paenibacillus sp. WQ 127069]